MEYNNAISVAGNEGRSDADSDEVTSDIRMNDIDEGRNGIVVVGAEDATPSTADHGGENYTNQVENDDNDTNYSVVDVNRLYNSPSMTASSDLRHVLERTRTRSIERFFHEEYNSVANSKEASPRDASPRRTPQTRRGTPIEVMADDDDDDSKENAVPHRQRDQELRRRRRRGGTEHHSNDQDGNTPIRKGSSTHSFRSSQDRNSNFSVHVNADGVVEVGGEGDDDENDDENPADVADEYKSSSDGTDNSDDDDDDDEESDSDDDGSGDENDPGRGSGKRTARRKAKKRGRRRRPRQRLMTWFEWCFKDFWVSTKTMLRRKSREVRSDMETKATRYKAWSRLKAVYGERFIVLLTAQATRNGFMENWIAKLDKFNIYYKQFSFGGRRKKVVAIIMEVPDNTLELAAEAMKMQKQVAPRFGSIWIPFTQANRNIFVKDDKKDNDIVRRMAAKSENALIEEIRQNIEEELTRTSSNVSHMSSNAYADGGADEDAEEHDLQPQSSTEKSIDALLEDLERDSGIMSRRNASKSFCPENTNTARSVGGMQPECARAAAAAATGSDRHGSHRSSRRVQADFPVFSSAEIQYITHWMLGHRDWLGLDINAETLRGNVVRNGCFPLHNEGMRIKLRNLLLKENIFWPLLNFSKENNMSNMNLLEDIRFYMGDDAAWFYAFADFLSQTFLHLVFYGVLCLTLIAAIGNHVQQIQYTIYALIMSVSVQLSIKRWKRLRAKLRLRWGVGESFIFFSDSDENIRYKTSQGEHESAYVSSPVTGEKFAIYPIWKRKTKQLVSFFVLFIFNAGLLGGIYWLFKQQKPITLNKLHMGNLSDVLATQLPTALGYGLIIPILVIVYDLLARFFSEWENYRTNVEQSNSFVVKRFPFQFFVYYSAVLITAFSEVDIKTFKVNNDDFERTRTSLMIQVATFMCIHVLLLYSIFVFLNKITARIRLFNFKFVIKNGTTANIQEKIYTRQTACCCIPVNRKRQEITQQIPVSRTIASPVGSSSRRTHDDDDFNVHMNELSAPSPPQPPSSSRITNDYIEDDDEMNETDADLSVVHPISMVMFLDCSLRKFYYDVRRFCFIFGNVMRNDKDDEQKQLYFGKAEAMLRRMRALSGAEKPSMLLRDSAVSSVMRSVSSVIVSATKSQPETGGRRKRRTEQVIEQARPRTACAPATKNTSPSNRDSQVSESRIRTIQMRWRLRKAKRLLEKISAEKILSEIAMCQFDLDEEYSELMMVSGFVWILAAVFPLAPLLACLSCYVIIRGCTMKILISSRRPWPQKRYDIGSWLTVLEVISAFAIICNSAYMVVFEVIVFATRQSVTTKFLIGIGIEHGLILLKFFISIAVRDIPIDVALELRRQKNVRQQKIGDSLGSQTVTDSPAPSPNGRRRRGTSTSREHAYNVDERYFIDNL